MGHIVSSNLISWVNSKLFCMVAVQVYIPTDKGPFLLHFFNIGYLFFFDGIHSNRCGVIAHRDCSLHFPWWVVSNVEHVLCIFGHLKVFFGKKKCVYSVLFPIFKLGFCGFFVFVLFCFVFVLLLSYRNYFYILNINPNQISGLQLLSSVT